MDIKRRHHYVPRFYLSGWENKKKIYVLSDNEIKQMKAKGVLFEQNFNELPIFNQNQRSFFWNVLCKKYVEFKNPAMQSAIKIVNNILDVEFNSQLSLIKCIDELEGITNNSNSNEQILEYRANLIEDYLSGYEDKWAIVLQKLKNNRTNEIEKLDYADYEDLCSFIAFMLCRTKFMRDNQLRLIKHELSEQNSIVLSDEEINGILLIFFNFIMPVQITNLFLNEKIIFTLIKNTSDMNFITNDNPVRNIKFNKNLKGKEFLVPISPKILLKAEILFDDKVVDYLNEEFKDDKVKMQNWMENLNDTKSSDFPRSTGKSIFNYLLFQESCDAFKVREVNKMINDKRHYFIVGYQESDLEIFISDEANK